MRLFDFGAENGGSKPETLKAVAWPINVWGCYIPDNVNPNLNIIEKLILSLISKGIVKTESEIQEILINQLRLNENLVHNVLQECRVKHFNQNYKKELRLKVDSEKALKAIEGEISPGMDMSDTMKRVYLLQDAVTSLVVPRFNIDQLPSEGESVDLEKGDCVSLGWKYKQQPSTSAINNALRIWGKIFKKMNVGETAVVNGVNLESDSLDEEDEISIKDPMVNALPDKESLSKNIGAITIFDDEPKAFYALGYLKFDPSNPTEITPISPFGPYFDNWFMKLFNKVRVSDSAFEDELELFLIEKQEQFKETVALGNHFDIQLFDDFPAICNDKKYDILKKAIEELSKSVARIRSGEDDTTAFVIKLRTAIEVTFRTVIDANPEIKQMKKTYKIPNGFSKYTFDLRRLVETYRLNPDIQRWYIREGIYHNVINSNQSNTKDNAALILLYANLNPQSGAMNFVQDYDNLFVEIIGLINLGNNVSHGGDKYKNLYLTKEDAENYYSQFENIVRTLFENFMEGK